MYIHNDHQHTMNQPLLGTEAGFEPDDLDRKVGLFSPLEPESDGVVLGGFSRGFMI